MNIEFLAAELIRLLEVLYGYNKKLNKFRCKIFLIFISGRLSSSDISFSHFCSNCFSSYYLFLWWSTSSFKLRDWVSVEVDVAVAVA